MKKIVFTFLVFAYTIHIQAQTKQDTADIIEAGAYNYVGAWFGAKPELMKESLHPYMSKMRVVSEAEVKSSSTGTLVSKAGDRTPQTLESINLTYQVLDVDTGKAAMLVTNSNFWDMVLLTKEDGKWMINCVVWDYYNIPTGTEEDVKKTIEGFYKYLITGEVDPFSPLLHQYASIRKVLSREKVDALGKVTLIYKCEKKRWGDTLVENLGLDTKVLLLYNGYASVKVRSAFGTEYFHLRYLGSKWYIMNGIWERDSEAKTIDPKVQVKALNGEGNSIQIYPNPMNDMAFVQLPYMAGALTNIQLFDIEGKYRTASVGMDQINERSVLVHRSEVVKGVYFLVVYSKNESYTARLVIN